MSGRLLSCASDTFSCHFFHRAFPLIRTPLRYVTPRDFSQCAGTHISLDIEWESHRRRFSLTRAWTGRWRSFSHFHKVRPLVSICSYPSSFAATSVFLSGGLVALNFHPRHPTDNLLSIRLLFLEKPNCSVPVSRHQRNQPSCQPGMYNFC